MNEAWPERILRSFELIGPRVDELTGIFYDRLFALRPDTRAMFRQDMTVQRQHLAASLALIARNLHMLDTLETSLRELGANHARVGVKPEHYPVVRDAMLAALAQVAGDAWTDQLRDDWGRLLNAIATQMLAGGTSNSSRRGGAVRLDI